MNLDYSASPPAWRRQAALILAFPAVMIYAVLLARMLTERSLNSESFSQLGWLALGVFWLIALVFVPISYLRYFWLQRPRSLRWYEVICLLANTLHLLLTIGIYVIIHRYAISLLPPILR